MTQSTPLTPSPAPTAKASKRWNLDGSHSSVTFSVRHLMISNVKGEFAKISASANYDPKQPELAKVTARIDVSSIDTNEAKRDDHLRSADFFDVQNYPEITFESSAAQPKGANELLLVGKLSIHGVTKDITLKITDLSAPAKDPWGNQRVGATASTTIKRSDFGMTWNNVLEAGGVVVGDEIKITIDASFVQDNQ